MCLPGTFGILYKLNGSLTIRTSICKQWMDPQDIGYWCAVNRCTGDLLLWRLCIVCCICCQLSVLEIVLGSHLLNVGTLGLPPFCCMWVEFCCSFWGSTLSLERVLCLDLHLLHLPHHSLSFGLSGLGFLCPLEDMLEDGFLILHNFPKWSLLHIYNMFS